MVAKSKTDSKTTTCDCLEVRLRAPGQVRDQGRGHAFGDRNDTRRPLRHRGLRVVRHPARKPLAARRDRLRRQQRVIDATESHTDDENDR